MLSLISKILGKAGSAIGKAGGAARGAATGGAGRAAASAGLGVFNGAATGAAIGSAIPGVGSIAGAVVGGVTSAPVRAGLGGLARRLGLSKAGTAATGSAAAGAVNSAESLGMAGGKAASNLAGALIGDAPAASKAARATEEQVASVSRKKNRGAGRREKIARQKEAGTSSPVRTGKDATLNPNASELAASNVDDGGLDLPMRKGRAAAGGMQSGDPLFSGQVSGAVRPTEVGGAGAKSVADEVSDFPARKGGGGPGMVQSGDSLFSGQVPGATRPTSAESVASAGVDADLPRAKYTTQGSDSDTAWSKAPYTQTDPDLPRAKYTTQGSDSDTAWSKAPYVQTDPDLPVRKAGQAASGAPPAPGVNPAAPDPSAGPTTGAEAAKKMPGPPERLANIVTGVGGDEANDIKKLKDPSRLIDWAVGPAIGAAIGGAEGFINYDSSKEKDPLMRETPLIARIKAGGEGAAKGAGYAAAGIVGERAVVGLGKTLMSEHERMLLPGPISLTEAFTKGFGSTAGASGTTSMGGIANRVTGAFDESSGYVAALQANRGIKAEEAVSGKIRQVEREAAEAAKKRGAAAPTSTSSAPTASQQRHAAAEASWNQPGPRAPKREVTYEPTPNRKWAPGEEAAYVAALNAPKAAPTSATAGQRFAAMAPTNTPTRTVSAPPADFKPGSMTTPTPAPAAPATAAPAAAAPTPSATVTAATQASNANAPRVQSRVQIEQLNKQREKIRNNTANSMMHLPDHMNPQRISDVANSGGRGLMDAGVIAATGLGALAGTPILMAKQAVHNYKEHILTPNEKTSQVSAGFSRIQNPWLSEGQATGDYGIRSTLDAQIGDGAIARNVIAAGVTATVGGAAMFGAMGATSYGGGPGHPMNALQMRDPAISAKAQMDADASNKIRMSDPSQLGLADAEEMYYSNPSMRPVQSRSRPGQYNDTGNLTLALSALRRG